MRVQRDGSKFGKVGGGGTGEGQFGEVLRVSLWVKGPGGEDGCTSPRAKPIQVLEVRVSLRVPATVSPLLPSGLEPNLPVCSYPHVMVADR